MSKSYNKVVVINPTLKCYKQVGTTIEEGTLTSIVCIGGRKVKLRNINMTKLVSKKTEELTILYNPKNGWVKKYPNACVANKVRAKWGMHQQILTVSV